ncbi:MAG: hypothetical protein ABIY55_07785 [Kofleriaceae bacterium]
MQPTPPCPMCGSPLRWFPDHQRWGCDRCQQLIASPPVAAAMPMATAKPASKKLVWIALAAAVVAAGVVMIVLVTRGRKGGETASSIDEAVKQTFVALGNGDADALISGAHMPLLKAYSDCTKEDADQDDKEQDDMRREFRRAARREKGAKFEIVSIDDSKTKKLAKGDKAGKDCVFKADVTIHEVKLELSVTRASQTYTQAGAQVVLEVDGHFVVVNVPNLPGCSTAVARVALLAERAHDDRDLGVDTCITEKWPDARIACLSHALTLGEADACTGKAWELPQECKDYAAVVERMTRCDKMDASIQKIFRDGYESNAKSDAWKGKRPPYALKLLPESCATSARNIKVMLDRDCPL